MYIVLRSIILLMGILSTYIFSYRIWLLFKPVAHIHVVVGNEFPIRYTGGVSTVIIHIHLLGSAPNFFLKKYNTGYNNRVSNFSPE